LRDLMLYLSFKFVRKFKFCVSPLVKRYPELYFTCRRKDLFKYKDLQYRLLNFKTSLLLLRFQTSQFFVFGLCFN